MTRVRALVVLACALTAAPAWSQFRPFATSGVIDSVPGPTPPTIITASLTNCVEGLSCVRTIVAVDGTGPYAWSITAGELPPGVTLGASIILSVATTGTAGTAETYCFTIRVQDTNGLSDTADICLTVNDASPSAGHPKVGIMAAEIPTLRTYITTYQDAPMEALLVRLDAAATSSCAATSVCGGTDSGWMALNFALLNVVGSSWLKNTATTIAKPAGYADFDTDAEVCAIAYSYLTKVNSSASGPPSTSIKALWDAVLTETNAQAAVDELHAMTGSNSGSLWYATVPLVYDWCHDSLSGAQQSALEDSIRSFALGACSAIAEWPVNIITGIAGNGFVVGNRGVGAARFLGSLAMYGAVGQGVLDATYEGYINDCIRKIWVNQIFTELSDLFTRRGMASIYEARWDGGYAADVLFGMGFATFLGRTIPAFSAASAPLQTWMEQMPTYLMNTFLPDPVTTPGSERQWMITWGTTGDGLYYLTDGAPYSRALPLLLGACRANGWSCDGKWRWIMDHTWGAGSYDTTNLDSTAAVETGSIFYRILGGWGGVSAVDATPTTAEAGNEHFVWKPLTGTMVQFSAQTQDGGGHNSTSGHLGQEFGTFDIFKYGFLGLHTSLGGKGGFLDDPVVANVNQSRLYFWKNDDTSNNNVTGGGPGTGIAGVAIELSGEEEPDWEARCASCFNHEKDMKIYAANVDGSAVYAAVGVDSSSNFNSSVVGTNGFAEQYMQREFVLFKALDFAVVMDRSKVATPTTYKRAWRMVVPSLPTFDGTTTHPYAGWWQSTNSTYFKVENISGGPGSGAWSGTDADGTRGTFNRTHGRMFVLPVTTGTAYDAFVARGYDSGFTNSALLYDSNLIFQQTGNPGRPTSVEADRFGTASAYTVTTSPCVIGFTDTPTLLASTVIRRLSLGGAAPVRNLAITATDNSAKTVTVTATTCPSIPMGTPVDYAIFRYAAGEKKYQWDAAAQRIGGWGRIELPKFSTTTATENWVVAMHFGDSDTFSTPTAVTAIDSASQFGLQAHGNGVEAVVLFSDAYVDIGTSMFDAVPTSSFPLGGSTYTYDFTCYTSTAIRHVLPNHQPATTYTVSVSNLGGTSCRASVTKTGGAITVLAIDGVLTFTTTGTTVS